MALVPEKQRRVKRPILVTPATKVSARRKRGVGVVLSIIKSSASAESLTAQQRGELQAAKRRVEAALAKPGLSADALRARAQSAAKWESKHGLPTVFAGPTR
ncbi:hypothetical protein [Robbsia andropogonis]|uniref:hypothetical protein n=1 Tax=Robbsia andropogonis TaxID=28092 RepID=UPI0020A02793|nr:hypothetical protein [Robbsia andropogonis]MCP1121650.1 hypothetical protein [Robbsia andropogonis]MCP1131472.1 hypothetical protein [Robbsia andropogonis]